MSHTLPNLEMVLSVWPQKNDLPSQFQLTHVIFCICTNEILNAINLNREYRMFRLKASLNTFRFKVPLNKQVAFVSDEHLKTTVNNLSETTLRCKPSLGPEETQQCPQHLQDDLYWIKLDINSSIMWPKSKPRRTEMSRCST